MKTKLKILTVIVAVTVTTLSFSFGGKRIHSEKSDINTSTKTFEEPIGGFVSERI